MTRLEKLDELQILDDLLWEEGFKEIYPGYFDKLRERIETMDERELMDLWCRGQNLIGFADSILDAVDSIREAIRETTEESASRRKGKP